MRHLLVLVLIVGTLLALPTGNLVAGQAGTPSAAPEFVLPDGVTSDQLAIDVAATLPAAPAAIELIRFTFEPGAVFHLPEESPSTALVYVEAGSLTARVAAPLTVTRAEGGEREQIAADVEFTAERGDFFIGPAYVAAEARNDGAEPLLLMMAVVQPAGNVQTLATPAP